LNYHLSTGIELYVIEDALVDLCKNVEYHACMILFKKCKRQMKIFGVGDFSLHCNSA
jgi:hypothetical protein